MPAMITFPPRSTASANGIHEPAARGHPRWPTPTSCERSFAPRSRTKTRRAATRSSPKALACIASRGPTRPRRSRRGGEHAGAASSCCRPARARRHVAMMAIDDKRRSTLVVAPTLDLVRQWYDLLRGDVRRAGGRRRRRRARRAAAHRDHLRLGVPPHGAPRGTASAWWSSTSAITCRARAYALAARLVPRAVSPRPHRDARAQPTAARPTLDELDRADRLPQGHRRALAASTWPTTTPSASAVELTPDEREEYEAERAIYRELRREHGIRMASPTGWGEFIMRSSRSAEGRRAMAGVPHAARARVRRPGQARLPRAAACTCTARDRAIVFTQDNATAYAVSRRFLVPAITHQTKVKERSDILAGLADGELRRGRHLEGAERGGRRARRRTWRSCSRAAARCASTCSASGASCARRRASAPPLRARHRATPARRSPATGGASTVLTADLVNARRRGAELHLTKVSDETRARANRARRPARRGFSRRHRAIARRGRRLAGCGRSGAPRSAAQGWAHQVARGSRQPGASTSDLEPDVVRREVFTRATAARASLGPGERFDRGLVLAEVAKALRSDADSVERALFADLRGDERALRVRSGDAPPRSSTQYEGGQAQAVLLRAVRVVIDVASSFSRRGAGAVSPSSSFSACSTAFARPRAATRFASMARSACSTRSPSTARRWPCCCRSSRAGIVDPFGRHTLGQGP